MVLTSVFCMYVRQSEEKVHTYKILENLTKIMLESALRKKKISKVYLKVSKCFACGGQSTFTMNKFIDPRYRGPKWSNILKISKKLYVRQKPNKKHCSTAMGMRQHHADYDSQQGYSDVPLNSALR